MGQIDERTIAARAVVQALGGGGKVARWLHLHPQTVYYWTRAPSGVPCEHVPDLVAMARCLNPPVPLQPEQIRPDVPWHKLKAAA